ncbi:hypothetical protein B0H11DRAFT_1914485 [Mycena galericulata]|nr:hypothetical protein B0H11DRAFT_1914485 [Mycena galericulata]
MASRPKLETYRAAGSPGTPSRPPCTRRPPSAPIWGHCSFLATHSSVEVDSGGIGFTGRRVRLGLPATTRIYTFRPVPLQLTFSSGDSPFLAIEDGGFLFKHCWVKIEYGSNLLQRKAIVIPGNPQKRTASRYGTREIWRLTPNSAVPLQVQCSVQVTGSQGWARKIRLKLAATKNKHYPREAPRKDIDSRISAHMFKFSVRGWLQRDGSLNNLKLQLSITKHSDS